MVQCKQVSIIFSECCAGVLFISLGVDAGSFDEESLLRRELVSLMGLAGRWQSVAAGLLMQI